MTTTHANGSTHNYDAARLALAAHDDPSIVVAGADGFPLIGSVERAEWVISQLRPVIEPAGTTPGPVGIAQRIAERHAQAAAACAAAGFDLRSMLEDAAHAGIQAGWESWEPDSSFGADLPKPEPLEVHSEGLEVSGYVRGGDPRVDVLAWGRDAAEDAESEAEIRLSAAEARALAAALVANADAADAAADA